MLGVLLQLLAHVRQRRALAVPDRDHVVGAHEELDLSELDSLEGVDVASGLEHHEEIPVVDLDLGPLVRAHRVLDRQVVEPELAPHRKELGRRRLEEADPHERVRLAGCLQRLLERQLTRASQPVGVHRAVHDHAHIIAQGWQPRVPWSMPST